MFWQTMFLQTPTREKMATFSIEIPIETAKKLGWRIGVRERVTVRMAPKEITIKKI